MLGSTAIYMDEMQDYQDVLDVKQGLLARANMLGDWSDTDIQDATGAFMAQDAKLGTKHTKVAMQLNDVARLLRNTAASIVAAVLVCVVVASQIL